jgi:hypothetical protein
VPGDIDRKNSANLIGFTTGSVIMSLDTEKAEIAAFVSKGPPSLRGYVQVHLNGATDAN